MRSVSCGFSKALPLIIGALVLAWGSYFVLSSQGGAASSAGGGSLGYQISETKPAACPTCPMSDTITFAHTLPEGARLRSVGGGMLEYTNPTRHFSFDFPTTASVRVLVQDQPVYSVVLHTGTGDLHEVLVGIYGQKDPLSGQPNNPPATPSADAQTVRATGTKFSLWNNVAYAQKYGSNGFVMQAMTPNQVTVVPGDAYYLDIGAQFNTATQTDAYAALLTKIASSVVIR